LALIVDGSVVGTPPWGTYLCKVLIRLCLYLDLEGYRGEKVLFFWFPFCKVFQMHGLGLPKSESPRF
jgi:hypothetical protein